ncbi:hypothetical protein CVT26_000931 [Gymnopilus dilepis]|uniref:Uncharacterized protein n=1 Tax=Gymnopilus dilepis TaxID=231916 RepID=A0A409VHZ1_9AGAR|nr:hypothetical protein CVT26_000931 [Gymnopilus dilepis]
MPRSRLAGLDVSRARLAREDAPLIARKPNSRQLSEESLAWPSRSLQNARCSSVYVGAAVRIDYRSVMVRRAFKLKLCPTNYRSASGVIAASPWDMDIVNTFFSRGLAWFLSSPLHMALLRSQAHVEVTLFLRKFAFKDALIPSIVGMMPVLEVIIFIYPLVIF